MTAISSPEGGMSRRAALLLLGTATALAIPAVRYLSQNLKAEENEAEKPRVIPIERERNKDQRRIAVVDDYNYYAESLGEFILRTMPGSTYDYYETCQPLLTAIDSGTKYDAYVIDFDPGETDGLFGDICTEEILIRHHGALVIGISSDDSVGSLFKKAGAREFFGIQKGGDVIAQAIKEFFP